MREREEEIKNIHKGMHTVNEIYKVTFYLVLGTTFYTAVVSNFHRLCCAGFGWASG